MSILAANPSHALSWERDSITEASVDACSSEPDELPPTVVHPSPYRGCTAAAFADINQALATRSLRESVRITPGLPTPRNAGRPGICPRSPSYLDTTLPRSMPAHQEKAQPVSRPQLSDRSRSMPLSLKFHARNGGEGDSTIKRGTSKQSSPLHFPGSSTASAGTRVDVKFEPAKSSGSKSHSFDGIQAQKDKVENADRPAHGPRLARTRRSTTSCTIM